MKKLIRLIIESSIALEIVDSFNFYIEIVAFLVLMFIFEFLYGCYWSYRFERSADSSRYGIKTTPRKSDSDI